jgi:hypothetical protein
MCCAPELCIVNLEVPKLKWFSRWVKNMNAFKVFESKMTETWAYFKHDTYEENKIISKGMNVYKY